ncbi:flagellar biosynthetic protein FliO [Candidatus Berkiella aquae]|uniref:Flagellar protein n=1 Tax=Candidatus Berkiella aquae TaxID=295108 RepID=A0A0Q9YL47_9GAMM|nr:flagellar biosynthetic protein FliO [Candidatus Berkiella aquae]MCS5711414.1 flagellar biosynthetic protein FliO [Candidatus Berkiella aquae]
MVNLPMVANVALMLVITIVLVFALAYLLKHFKKMVPQFSGVIQVLGGASLGNKSKLVLVEAYDTQILVGVSDSQIQTLHVFKKKPADEKPQLP